MKRPLVCLILLCLLLCPVGAQTRHYDFDDPLLGSEWRYVGQPDASKYGVSPKSQLKTFLFLRKNSYLCTHET